MMREGRGEERSKRERDSELKEFEGRQVYCQVCMVKNKRLLIELLVMSFLPFFYILRNSYSIIKIFANLL